MLMYTYTRHIEPSIIYEWKLKNDIPETDKHLLGSVVCLLWLVAAGYFRNGLQLFQFDSILLMT